MTATTSAFVLEREQRRRTALYSELLEEEVSARTEELRETQLEVVSASPAPWSRAMRTPACTSTACATLCERLALALGLPPAEAELLRHAAVLHDVGKVGIPDRVLPQAGPLRRRGAGADGDAHAVIGAEILAGSSSPLIQLGAVIARSHHERWDGTGYPDGLAGEAIPFAARICAVCRRLRRAALAAPLQAGVVARRRARRAAAQSGPALRSRR